MIRSGTVRQCSLAVALAVCTASAWADVVTLSDGSRIVGTIKQLADNKLTMTTAFSESLEIAAALITGIETDKPVELQTTDGKNLAGQLRWSADRKQSIVEKSGATRPLPLTEAAMIWPEGSPSPAEIAEAKALEAKEAKWMLTVEAGARASEGNTDTLGARGKIELERKSEKNLWKTFLLGNYAEESDIRSAAEARAGTYFEHLFTERLFGYARGEAEYDEFENLSLRLTAAAGPGYYWIKEEAHELKTRAGLGYQHETFLDDETTESMGLDIGLDYRLDISKWLRFTNSTTYFPTFEELRDYRLESDFAFIIPIGDSEVWKFKLGARYEYDPLPSAGFEELDQEYYINLLAVLK